MAPLITEPSEDTNSQNQAWPNGSEIVQMLSPVTQSSHDVKNTGHDDDYPIVIDASDSGDMEDKAGLSSSTCKQDLDSLVHLVHDESSSSASDFTSPNTSMVAMQSQLHDQYIAQLVATDLTARTRQIGLLNQALEEKTSKLDQYSKENASLRVQLDQTLGEKAHLKKELGSLRMRVSQLENDKGMQEREISETTQRARELENECQTFVKRSIKLEERVSLLRERCVEFQHTLDGHATDATTLKVGISDLRRDAMSIKETRAFRFILTKTEHKRVDSIKRTLESVSQVFKVVQEEQFEQKQMLIGQIEELKVNKMEQQETIRMQEKDIAQHCTDANAAREQLKGVSDQLEVSLAERDKLAQSNSVVLNYILEGKANLESNLEQFHDKCVVHLQKAVQEKDQSIRDLVNQNQIQLAPASKEESVPERLLGCHEKVDQEVSSSDLKRKASDLMATKEQDNDVDVKVFKRAISEEDPGFPAPTCSTAQDQPDSTKAVAEGAAGEGCKGEAVDPIGCHKSTPESSQPEVQRKAKRGRPRKSEQGRANSAKGKAVAVS
ncbi:hypothetical protein BGX31_003373 [Mortierella sp. GBA43]|nr:hypothetical protein BGX31_003373 [Mortierella sp. GBA43]